MAGKRFENQQQSSTSSKKRKRSGDDDGSCYYQAAPMVPCIRMYCKTRIGMSVCVNVYGVYPVVHMLTSRNLFESPDIVPEIVEAIEARMRAADSKSDKRRAGFKYVLTYDIVRGFPASPFTPEPYSFIEMRLALPEFVKMFGSTFATAAESPQNSTLELPVSMAILRVAPYSCLNIVDQFMADKNLTGFGWIRVERYRVASSDICRLASSSSSLSSSYTTPKYVDASLCNLEIDTEKNLIHPVSDDDFISPLRLLTFDIECACSKGFPKPDSDPVILIACVCSEFKNGFQDVSRTRKIILQHGTSARLPANQINAEASDFHAHFVGKSAEKDLLDAFGKMVCAFDPDFVAGHNVTGFDLPYILKRSNLLGCHNASFMGRRTSRYWVAPREFTKQRKNGSTQTSVSMETPGRIQLDTLNWIQGSEKLRSYKLGFLGATILKESKADMPYQMIVPSWKTSDETRARLAHYCLQDAVLTHKLITYKQFAMVLTSVEIARQSRACAGKLLRSGVQVKVFSLFYNLSKRPNFGFDGATVLWPYEIPKSRNSDDKYAGAAVLEPERGFYGNEYIGCGDFRSLYPSIMIYLNIDFSTEIRHEKYREKYGGKTSPNGVTFCDPSKRLGLIPQIQTRLFSDRDAAKANMKKATDPEIKELYNTRQTQIKLLMNSFYGILGASGGRMVREQLALAVTSQGRQMIMTAKRIAESPPFNYHVIYGGIFIF